MTEGCGEGRRTAVTDKALGPLQAAAPVDAQRAVAAAVSRAAGPDPWGDSGPRLQVQGDPVQLQGAQAAPEALLPGRCAT